MRPDATPGRFTPKLLTVLQSGYRVRDFRADAMAGLTVAIVALPLAMALGIASGASPDKGLVTAVVAGLLISALGGSRVQIGGPTGAFVVVVFGVIAEHGYDGLILATLMAGALLVIAGYAQLGSLVKFIPHPVVTGFTAGIAVIIASSQVKDFLGLQAANVPADFIPQWMTYISALPTLSLASLGIGVFTLAVIVGLRAAAPKVPGFFVAIVLATILSTALGLSIDTIGSRFPDLPTGLPAPAWPDWSMDKVRAVIPSALTIAFLAGVEALLSAVVADGLTGFRHRSNQELVGQGFANMASALFGGLPATGALARTATNIKAGGRTPVAGMLHAVFLLLFVLFAGDVMAYVPLAALAAVLFVVAWGMSEAERFVHLLKMPSDDRAILLLTFVLTVLVDLTVAIAVGVVLASLMFMARMAGAVEISSPDGTTPASTVEEDQRVELPQGVEVYRITGPFFFGVASGLLDTLRRVGRTPKVLIVRMRLVPLLDTTGAQALRDFADKGHAMGIAVVFSGVQPQPLSLLQAVGLGHDSARVRHVPNYPAAIALARTLIGAPGVAP